MPDITLPDGSRKSFPTAVTVAEVAASIGAGLARAALAVDPKSASAWNNIAVSFMGLNRVDDAFEAAKEAVALDPNMQLAKNNIAWMNQEKAKAKK